MADLTREYDFLLGGGELGDLIRQKDWTTTPLGPLDRWPQSLKTSVSLIIGSRHPMWMGWGPWNTFLYNDAYLSVLDPGKHPWALGRPAAEVLAEVWSICGPLAEQVHREGKASFIDDVRLPVRQGDFLEDTLSSFSYSPIRDETGGVGGLLATHLDLGRLRRDSEDRFRFLFEQTTIGLAQVDLTGRFVLVNDRYCEIVGRTREELLTLTMQAITHPEDLAHNIPQFIAVAEGRQQQFTIEKRYIRPEGSAVWVRNNVAATRNRQGRVAYITAAVSDITDLKRRLQHEAFLAKLADEFARWSAPDEIMEAVGRRLGQYLGVTTCNFAEVDEVHDRVTIVYAWQSQPLPNFKRTYRISDYLSAEFREASRAGQTISVSNTQADRRADARSCAALKVYAFVTVPFHQEGTWTYLLSVSDQRPREWRADEIRLFEDVCNRTFPRVEQARAEMTLRHSEERLRLATATGKVGVWEWDVQENTVTWTDSLYAIHGIEPATTPITLERFTALVHPDDRPRLAEKLDGALKKRAPYELEFRACRPDGEPIWLYTNAVVLEDNGRPLRMIGATTDITASKRAAEQLQRWNVELERHVAVRTRELQLSQDRLRALTTELNLTEQRERKRLAAELHDHLQQILVLGKLKLGQGKRAAHDHLHCADVMQQVDAILTEALTYTRTLVSELSPPVLREHGLAAAVQWLGSYMKKHDLEVVVTVPTDQAVTLPEEQALLVFQSVRELLMNSWKHAGTGCAAVTMTTEPSALHIEVRDEGKGFELATTEPASEFSSKFGLFNIRERMKTLGGELAIDSAPGRGTRCLLSLPLGNWQVTPTVTASAVRRASPPPRPDIGKSQTTIRVLLVDDHAMVRQGLRSVLESYPGMEVVAEAGDGIEALEQLEHFRPTVVVMDINMPRMNGIEATVQIKSRYPEIRIIGLSVNVDSDNQVAMRNAGADVLVTKEAAVEQLYALITAGRTASPGSHASHHGNLLRT